MGNRDIDGNAKIKQAFASAVPDICDVILSDCEKEKGKVIVMAETKKKRNAVKYMMAAASLFVLIGAGALLLNIYQVNYAVDSIISLDVNPSIQITVNEKERVLDVAALNKDGEIVIGDMDFSGSDIDVTVNALIGSMLRNGYLNELANSILISVDNSDPAKGSLLQEKLTEEVNQLLEADGFFGAVLGQTITDNNTLKQQADQYGISTGKAQLIEQILNSTEGHTFEELAPLSINELNLIIASGAADMEKVSTFGNASDKAYIGEEKAKEIAYAHAKVTAQDIAFCEVDMDVEKGVMVYELDFKCNGYEYEYDIDARTGDIVKNKKEIDDDMPVGTQTPADGTTQTGTGNGVPSGGTTSPSNDQGTSQGGNSGASSAVITSERAKEIALNHAGLTADAVYFEKAELDYDNGIQIYELEFKSSGYEYEYDINAQTGDIVKNKKEADDDMPGNAQTPSGGIYYHHPEQNHGEDHHDAFVPAGNDGTVSGTITLEQAKEIALNHAGLTADAVYFEKAKLDQDGGMQIYEVEFKSGNAEYEYEIDAVTGAVRDYEWDYD